MCITVVLLGIVATSFMSGLTLTITASTTEEQTSLAEASARDAADYLRTQTYSQCGSAYATELPSRSRSLGDHTVSLTVVKVEVQNITSGGALQQGTDPNGQFVEALDTDNAGNVAGAATNPCAAGASDDGGLQRVTVRASVDNGAVTRDLSFIMRQDGPPTQQGGS